MKVQSLSVAVPIGCANTCKFCVSRMHHEHYKSILTDVCTRAHADKIMIRKLSFARDNGCNTLIITGSGEPMQNIPYLNDLAKWNWQLQSPFRWIEIQTSGRGLLAKENPIAFLRDVVGVSTISLSVVDIFDETRNAEIIGYTESIKDMCAEIKNANLNLRLSINMCNVLNDKSPEQIFDKCKELGANQVTFRELYSSKTDSKEDKWIDENNIDIFHLKWIINHILTKGYKLERLPFGATRYSVNEMSVVVDDDCMSTSVDKDELKYLILRPDGKLYTKWDDKGSLLF